MYSITFSSECELLASGSDDRNVKKWKARQGRLVGALFLLEAIAFVTIVTAVITSSFVERAHQERLADSEPGEAVGTEQLAAQLAEVTSRLERIQQTLDAGGTAESRTTIK